MSEILHSVQNDNSFFLLFGQPPDVVTRIAEPILKWNLGTSKSQSVFALVPKEGTSLAKTGLSKTG